MKKWLLLIGMTGILALAVAACGGGSGDDPQPAATPNLVEDGAGNSQAVCAPGFPDCNDMIVVDGGETDLDGLPPSLDDGATVDEPLPLAPDGVAPGALDYRVTISFNETYSDANTDETLALIQEWDGSAEYLIQESFPPTGVANVTTDAEGFCEQIVRELEAKSYVTAASCGPQLEPGDADPDEPVSSTPLR